MSRARHPPGRRPIVPAPEPNASVAATGLTVESGPSTHGLERLLYLTDGVFAIAMTLLVVDLNLPTLAADAPAGELTFRLWELRSAYLSYILSFLVIGSYWISHRRLFAEVVRADPSLMWLNIVFLLCIAFQPFPTRVLAEYGDQPEAVLFYAATVAATGLMVLVIWVYATTGHRLVRASLSRRVIQYRTLRALVVPLIFLVSMLIAPSKRALAEYIWLAIVPCWLILRWIYRDALRADGD